MTEVSSLPELVHELQGRFNFDAFHPGQAELIQALLAGRDAIGVLPTGSGKSLIYQFLAPHLNGLFVIVTPLISLMEDQANRIRLSKLGQVAILNGQLDRDEQRYVLDHLSKTKFLFLAPETLQRAVVIRRLKQLSIGLLTVDEAHCISSWGPDFRPDYLQLGAIRHQLKPTATLALTATATDRVVQDIRQSLLHNMPTYLYKASVDRSNLYLRTEFVQGREDKWQRLELLLQHDWPTLIYTSTRQQAEDLALLIAQRTKRKVAYYHAGLEGTTRAHIQQLFLHDRLDTVVATSAFGMGIDKQNIRLLIHDEMPANFENYLQEIGRAGRDGHPALTLIFVNQQDHERLVNRQRLHQLPSQLIENFFAAPLAATPSGLIEEQSQVLATYRRANFDVQTVVKLLQKTQRVREDQLQLFWEFLNSTECLREQICQYFDHQHSPEPHDETCCSQSTQLSLTAVIEQLDLPTTSVNHASPSLTTLSEAWSQLFDCTVNSSQKSV